MRKKDFGIAHTFLEWRCRSGNEQRHDSTIEEAFANTNLPIPHGPTALWEPGGVPGQWSDVCSFILPPGSETEWHIRMHGAFEIPHETLGIIRTDQSSHHEVRIHLLRVNARLVDRASRDGQYRQKFVRKKDSPYDHKQNHVATHARNPRGQPAPTKMFGEEIHERSNSVQRLRPSRCS